jgi:hypothetical protein
LPNVKIYQTYGVNHITVPSDTALSNLKAAVVVAEVVDMKGKAVHLSYAPVWFFDSFDFDAAERRKHRAYFGATFMILCICLCGIGNYFYRERLIKAKTAAAVTKENPEH